MNINILEIISAFLVLFAIIDAPGSVPIFLNIKSQNRSIHPEKATLYSLITLLGFLFVGEWLLKLFQVDISAFAVAGAIVLLIISIEMIFGVEIFRNDNPSSDNSSTLVPVVFPLIAPGSFTPFNEGRIPYFNIILGVVINMIVEYLVLRYLGSVKVLGDTGSYILRKFWVI